MVKQFRKGIALLCSMLNISSGAVTVALLCIRKQWRDVPSETVIASSTLLCGIVQLVGLLLRSKYARIYVILICTLTALTFGATISHFYFLLNSDKFDEFNVSLLTAQVSLLFGSMVFSGIHIDALMMPSTNKVPDDDYEKGEVQELKNDDKFVPLKASAQTLTPDLEIAIEKNWMNDYPTTYSGSDATSTPSVIKHKLPYQAQHNSAPTSFKTKLRNSSFATISPTSKKQVIQNIQRKLSIKSPNSKEKLMASGATTPKCNNLPETLIDAHYVTRLSTIADNSKSCLNVFKQANEVNSAFSVCLNETDSVDKNVLKMEKDAIDLYDSVLLPSILQNSNHSHSVVPSVISEDSKLEQLIEKNLGFGPPVQFDYSLKNSASQPVFPTTNCKTISVNYWNENKEKLLDNEKTIYSKSANALLPAFDVDANFSFPTKQTRPASIYSDSEGEDEMMNFVDKAIKPHDAKLMEQVLRQDSSSIVADMYSHNQHSPTKSINSLYTMHKTPIKFNSGVFTPQDARDDSQISIYLSTNHTKNTSSRQIWSAQSSPTKLTKRLSQRLSKSNLRSDEEIDTYRHLHSKSLTFTNFQHHHSKSNSVNHIDLSYLHSLQKKHSPQKSITTLNARRRSSIYQSTSDIKVSAVNLSKHEISVEEPKLTDDSESSDNVDDDIYNSSGSLKYNEKFSGVDTGLSEYDREKLSILVNRQKSEISNRN